ncbi:hypothetical protein HMI55_001334 [Coelomomyces lativittatus]|nr:hypothetical protein HMI55_001334 [Coelomomyces lativittatus]
MDYFHDFFKEKSPCYQFWMSNKASIKNALASSFLSNNLRVTFGKLIEGKLKGESNILKNDNYLGFHYFPSDNNFEFMTLNVYCRKEDVQSNLRPLFSSNRVHFENIMKALEDLLQTKLQLQLITFVKKRILKSPPLPSFKNVKSPLKFMFKSKFYKDDWGSRVLSLSSSKIFFFVQKNKLLSESLSILYDNNEFLFDWVSAYLENGINELNVLMKKMRYFYLISFDKILKSSASGGSKKKRVFSVTLKNEHDWTEIKINEKRVELPLLLTTHFQEWANQEKLLTLTMNCFQKIKELSRMITEWEMTLYMLMYEKLRSSIVYKDDPKVIDRFLSNDNEKKSEKDGRGMREDNEVNDPPVRRQGNTLDDEPIIVDNQELDHRRAKLSEIAEGYDNRRVKLSEIAEGYDDRRAEISEIAEGYDDRRTRLSTIVEVYEDGE